MTAQGPQGAAVFNYHGKYRLAVGADSTVYLHLQTPAAPPGPSAADVDLSGYATFVGAGRRERNEVLTTAPLFTITGTLTTADLFSTGVPVGDGTDGYLTLSIDGTEIGQDTPARGYFDVFGRTAGGARVLLVTGRWECAGGTLDPDSPASA